MTEACYILRQSDWLSESVKITVRPVMARSRCPTRNHWGSSSSRSWESMPVTLLTVTVTAWLRRLWPWPPPPGPGGVGLTEPESVTVWHWLTVHLETRPLWQVGVVLGYAHRYPRADPDSDRGNHDATVTIWQRLRCRQASSWASESAKRYCPEWAAESGFARPRRAGWHNDHDGQPEARIGGPGTVGSETERHHDPSRPGVTAQQLSLSEPQHLESCTSSHLLVVWR